MRARVKPLNLIAVSPTLGAAMCDLHARDFAEALRSGEIPHAVFGQRKRILVDDIKTYLTKRKAVSHGDDHAS